MKCPKCGSEMIDVRDWDENNPDLKWYCRECGHEEKVKP